MTNEPTLNVLGLSMVFVILSFVLSFYGTRYKFNKFNNINSDSPTNAYRYRSLDRYNAFITLLKIVGSLLIGYLIYVFFTHFAHYVFSGPSETEKIVSKPEVLKDLSHSKNIWVKISVILGILCLPGIFLFCMIIKAQQEGSLLNRFLRPVSRFLRSIPVEQSSEIENPLVNLMGLNEPAPRRPTQLGRVRTQPQQQPQGGLFSQGEVVLAPGGFFLLRGEVASPLGRIRTAGTEPGMMAISSAQQQGTDGTEPERSCAQRIDLAWNNFLEAWSTCSRNCSNSWHTCSEALITCSEHIRTKLLNCYYAPCNPHNDYGDRFTSSDLPSFADAT